jgi:hypothetical protein
MEHTPPRPRPPQLSHGVINHSDFFGLEETSA